MGRLNKKNSVDTNIVIDLDEYIIDNVHLLERPPFSNLELYKTGEYNEGLEKAVYELSGSISGAFDFSIKTVIPTVANLKVLLRRVEDSLNEESS